jgi:hypothetical protein
MPNSYLIERQPVRVAAWCCTLRAQQCLLPHAQWLHCHNTAAVPNLQSTVAATMWPKQGAGSLLVEIKLPGQCQAGVTNSTGQAVVPAAASKRQATSRSILLPSGNNAQAALTPATHNMTKQ